MIAGAIVPPGCFLDAPNMLKRQYLAFCMDSLDGQEACDPCHCRAGCSGTCWPGSSGGGFPESFLSFYAEHKADLMADFLALFANVISTGTRSNCWRWLAAMSCPAACAPRWARSKRSGWSCQATYRSLQAHVGGRRGRSRAVRGAGTRGAATRTGDARGERPAQRTVRKVRAQLLHRRRVAAQLRLSRNRRQAAGDHHRPGAADARGEGLSRPGVFASGSGGDPRAGALQHASTPKDASWL